MEIKIFVFVALMLFLSGFLGKLADGHVDNGVTFGKRYTNIFDIAWAAIWCYLFFYSHNLYIVLVSVVLFWVYKLKFDFKNHGICLVAFIFGIILYQNINHSIVISYGVWRTIFSIALLLWSYILLSYLKKFNKGVAFVTSLFIPSFFALYTGDPLAGCSIFFFFGGLSSMRVFKMKQKSFVRD